MLCLLHTRHTRKAWSVGGPVCFGETVPVLLHPTENIGSTGFLLVRWREVEPTVLYPLEAEFRAPGSSFGFKFLLSCLLSVSRESLPSLSKPQLSVKKGLNTHRRFARWTRMRQCKERVAMADTLLLVVQHSFCTYLDAGSGAHSMICRYTQPHSWGSQGQQSACCLFFLLLVLLSPLPILPHPMTGAHFCSSGWLQVLILLSQPLPSVRISCIYPHTSFFLQCRRSGFCGLGLKTIVP